LISLDGFLAAQFAAAQDKDGGNDGNNAADNDAKRAIAIVVHDVVPTSACAPGSNWVSREFGKIRCRIWAISGKLQPSIPQESFAKT